MIYEFRVVDELSFNTKSIETRRQSVKHAVRHIFTRFHKQQSAFLQSDTSAAPRVPQKRP